jgi:hypothetical protein
MKLVNFIVDVPETVPYMQETARCVIGTYQNPGPVHQLQPQQLQQRIAQNCSTPLTIEDHCAIHDMSINLPISQR